MRPAHGFTTRLIASLLLGATASMGAACVEVSDATTRARGEARDEASPTLGVARSPLLIEFLVSLIVGEIAGNDRPEAPPGSQAFVVDCLGFFGVCAYFDGCSQTSGEWVCDCVGAAFNVLPPLCGGTSAVGTTTSPLVSESSTDHFARNQDGRGELFKIGADAAVYHRYELSPGGDWSDWDRLGGAAKQIDVVANQDGRLELFAIGADDAVKRQQELTPLRH